MFIEASDLETGVVVWLFTGPANSDDDYAAYVASLKRLDGTMTTLSVDRPAALQVVDEGNPIPGPQWRKQIADASRNINPRAMFGLVSTSTLVRGVVVAINWIRPPRYTVSCHATFDDGVRWVEAARGPTPQLHTLYAEARARARR